MKRCCLLIMLLLMPMTFNGCGNRVNEDAMQDVVESSGDSFEDEYAGKFDIDKEDINPLPSLDEYVAAADLSEEELLKVFDEAVSAEDYDTAGSYAYRWLKSHDSETVSNKLADLVGKLYISDYSRTTYDADDNVISIAGYIFNEHEDVLEESYTSSDGDYTKYNYHYVYDGDEVISQICYDEEGNVIFDWEATLDSNGNILSEVTKHDNYESIDSIEHIRDDSGECIKEHSVYCTGDEIYEEEITDFNIVDGLLLDTKYYNDKGDLTSCVKYEYDDNKNTVKEEYYDGVWESYLIITYDYDESNSVTRRYAVSGEYTDEFLYTYDKFGNVITEQYYRDGDLSSETKYDYDFLGNVVIETVIINKEEIVTVYDYTYELKSNGE